MCCSLIFLASSMNGRFSASLSAFHSAPSRLLSSELCIRGFSCASSFRRCLDQTMKAFIGRLMWSGERLDMTVIAKFAPLLHSRSSLQIMCERKTDASHNKYESAHTLFICESQRNSETMFYLEFHYADKSTETIKDEETQ